MGKRKWQGSSGRDGRSRKKQHHNGKRADYPAVEKSNVHLEKYYNNLGILTSPEDAEQFWAALRRVLPNSFRFTGSKGHALAVRQRLTEQYIPEILSMKFEGEPVEPPVAVPWFPNQLAYAMTTPKNVVRRFSPFKKFQQFLVTETEVGNISRQEIVSMIPPLLIDVKPGMTVLDMCAAPGSKTAQLIELVHAGEETRTRKMRHQVAVEQGHIIDPEQVEVEAEKGDLATELDWEDDGRATGLVIANDADYKRSHMLIHQTKRLNSPNLIVTNHDATMFPLIELPQPADGQKHHKYLKFDRILADVPCSGDGTARKNPNIWKDWIPGNALGLHLTQVRILVRGLQLLKPGGRIVYSTCSMNPVENEAVISSAIDRYGGIKRVKIVDCSAELPGLKRRSGLTGWQVIDKQGRTWSSWKEVEEHMAEHGDDGLARIVDGMFPYETKPEQRIPLENCMRVYPHLQDTGGFFITVLEKLSDFKAYPENRRKTVYPGTGKVFKKSSNNDAASAAATADTTPPNEAPKTGSGDATAEKSIAKQPDVPVKESDVPIKEETVSSEAQENGDEAAEPLAPITSEVKDEDMPDANGEEAVESTAETNGAEDVEPPPPEPVPDTERVPVEKTKGYQEEPYSYLDPNHAVLAEIREFYKIHSRFPMDRFLVRNAMGIPSKSIYYSSPLVRDIVRVNNSRGLKFVHAGVKMFVKQDANNPEAMNWRIQNEGLPILAGWCGPERTVTLRSRKILRTLLKEMFPKLTADEYEHLGDIGKQLLNFAQGCCILRIEPGAVAEDKEDAITEPMVLPIWRSAGSISLMLPKEERKALLLRLFDDDEPLVDLSPGGLRKAAEIQKAREAKAAYEKVGGTTKGDAVDEKDSGAENGANQGEDLDDGSDVEPELRAMIRAAANGK